MRVVVVDPSLFTLPYDRAFCRALAAAGADVTLVGRPLRAVETLDPKGFTFLPLFYRVSERSRRSTHSGRGGIIKGFEHVLGLMSLLRLIDRVRPDIMHFQWLALPIVDQLLLAAASSKTHLVMTAHNSGSVHMATSHLQQMGLHHALSRFAAIVAHTEKTRAWLCRQEILHDRILLLPHPPLDLTETDGAETVPPACPGATTVLFWGSIKPYKGVDVLVRAILEHMPPHANLRIVIAGQNFVDLTSLRAKIDSSPWRDRFVFEIGFLSESRILSWISAADIVVFPYREIDGSGALAATARFGKAIVASAVGVFAEPPARDSLELVPPDDPAALASRLLTLSECPARRAAAGVRSARLAELLPTWEQFAAACLELYVRTTKRRPAVTPRSAVTRPAGAEGNRSDITD